MTSRTLDLFLRSDLETIDIYDCGSELHQLHLVQSSYLQQNLKPKIISDCSQWYQGYKI